MRVETAAEALAIDERIARAWDGHPRRYFVESTKDFIAKAERSKLETIRTESVGFDDLRAGFDIGLVHAKHGFRLGGVDFVKAALRADDFVQHRAHSAIGDEDGVLQPFIKIEDFHNVSARKINYARARTNFSVFVP